MHLVEGRALDISDLLLWKVREETIEEEKKLSAQRDSNPRSYDHKAGALPLQPQPKLS